MTVCLTPDYLDPLMSLIRSVPGVALLYSQTNAWYVVKLRGTEIACGRDLIRVVNDAWGVLRADAAVRGIPAPQTELEQQRESTVRETPYRKFVRDFEARQLALYDHVLNRHE